jgi:hypothetical protein
MHPVERVIAGIAVVELIGGGASLAPAWFVGPLWLLNASIMIPGGLWLLYKQLQRLYRYADVFAAEQGWIVWGRRAAQEPRKARDQEGWR